MIPVLLSQQFGFSVTELIFGAIAIGLSLLELARAVKGDTKQDASSLTTVIVKLENIQDTVSDIRANIDRIEIDSRNLGERITKTEESVASLWNYFRDLRSDVRDLSGTSSSENTRHDSNRHHDE